MKKQRIKENKPISEYVDYSKILAIFNYEKQIGKFHLTKEGEFGLACFNKDIERSYNDHDVLNLITKKFNEAALWFSSRNLCKHIYILSPDGDELTAYGENQYIVVYIDKSSDKNLPEVWYEGSYQQAYEVWCYLNVDTPYSDRLVDVILKLQTQNRILKGEQSDPLLLTNLEQELESIEINNSKTSIA